MFGKQITKIHQRTGKPGRGRKKPVRVSVWRSVRQINNNNDDDVSGGGGNNRIAWTPRLSVCVYLQ